jgi:hypothetical protein
MAWIEQQRRADGGLTARVIWLNRLGFTAGRVLPAAAAIGDCCDGSTSLRALLGSRSSGRCAAAMC